MISAQLLGGGSSLGDARADIVSALALVMGATKAEAWMKSLESLIEKKAREGATQAIPTIKAEVIKAVTGQTPAIRKEVESAARGAVKPLIIGSFAVGGAGLLFGLVALIRSRRRS